MSKIVSTIVIPVAEAKTGGSLQGFVWDRFVEGEKIVRDGDTVKIYSTNANYQPTFADLAAIVSAGGSFEGIKLAIRFTNVAAAQQDVPSVVRGSTYMDENEVEQTRNWVQWFRANSTVEVITDGDSYVAKAVFNGKLLNSTELAAAHAQAGVNIIEWADAVALFQNEGWTKYEL